MFLYHIRGPPASRPLAVSLERQRGAAFRRSPPFAAGPWQSGLMRRIYNPCERVYARSVGPNPTGPANMIASVL